MRISHGTRIKTIAGINGYGYATLGMLESLDRLGYQVEQNDATADVEIWFDQPQHWKFSKGLYRIGYHPWESTELQEGWVDIMNDTDEIWTPSPLIAEWYIEAGVKVPVFVYEHGIDHVWSPVLRTPGNKTRYLHVGAEATRKGGWDTLRHFRTAFMKNQDVEFTMKMINSSWAGLDRVGKTNIINRTFGFEQLKNLFYEHDIYLYPSWGEGFGLTPLQAMASGMPTICTGAWAPYKQFLDPDLILDSTLSNHRWQEIHPGKMFKPDWDQFVDLMRYSYDNFEKVAERAFATAPKVHEYYDWDRLTSEVFGALEKRL